MGTNSYDAIVVGARCAGSPTAMLLARKGYRVLLVDKATFPSDTISTHLIHAPGVARLRRWGLLERLVATGCPPIRSYAFDMGPFVIKGSPGREEPAAYGPRRTVLDKLLVDAAHESGVEVREAFTVDQVLVENGQVTGIRGHAKGGQPVTESARVVVGADGVQSLVAKAVAAPQYNEKPHLVAGYYTYWSGLPMEGFEAYDRGDRNWAAWPTNDGASLVIVGWPFKEFEANKSDVEGQYFKALERAPAFAERVRAAKREERYYGTSVPNYLRRPYGAGWALVGDAGYNRDFITAQGISDAFRDADLCAEALHQSFTGAHSFENAMSVYATTRDQQVLPMFEFTCQFASFTPPTPEQQQLFAAIHGNQEASDAFVQMFGGSVSPAYFFSQQNVGRILAAAH